MAATLRFSSTDLLRCRFAISPVFETVSAIRLTSREESLGQHQRWLQSIRPRLDSIDLRPMMLLQPRRGYAPDFLAPPPRGPQVAFEDDLAAVAATPLSQVSAEIARSLQDTRGAADSELGRMLLGDPAEALALLIGLIRQFWQLHIEPVWPQVRAVLDADIGFQSRRLAEGGLDRLFAELHPALRWQDNTLTRAYGDDDHRELTGEGVLLMPSVFKWDQVVVVLDEPWQPTVIYPARGLGALWEVASGTTDAALARLLGRTRAALLTGLTEPTTTTTLAHRYALAAATVSEHLTALRDVRFIVGERHRHEVRYRRTELGDAVVGA